MATAVEGISTVEDIKLDEILILSPKVEDLIEAAINSNFKREEDPEAWDACRAALRQEWRDGTPDYDEGLKIMLTYTDFYPSVFMRGFQAARELYQTEGGQG